MSFLRSLIYSLVYFETVATSPCLPSYSSYGRTSLPTLFYPTSYLKTTYALWGITSLDFDCITLFSELVFTNSALPNAEAKGQANGEVRTPAADAPDAIHFVRSVHNAQVRGAEPPVVGRASFSICGSISCTACIVVS